MKYYIKSKNSTDRVEIEIIAVLSDNANSYVGSAHNIDLEYRDLPIEYQLSRKQFSAYVNFIKSVVSVIDKLGFDISDEYQSKKSYSYYVQFTPTPYIGFEDQLLELDVKFRLSNHYQTFDNISDDLTKPKTEGTIFSEFVVEGIKQDDIAATLLNIKNICVQLKQGDYSGLY